MRRKLLAIFYIIYFYSIFIVVKTLTIWFTLFKPKKNKNQIIYLELFGPPMAGYTARSKYWSDLLNRSGYRSEVISLTSYVFYKQCLQSTNGLMQFQIKTILRRVRQCLKSRNAQVLIVRREALMYNDYGNLFIEKWLRSMHNTIILDFDDDIAAAKNEGERERSTFSMIMLENTRKFTASLKFFDGFVYGTEYLKNIFSPYTQHAKYQLVLPTCVSHFDEPLKKYFENKAIKIGWVGSSYNLKNIESIFPALEKVNIKKQFEFVLICDENTRINTTFPSNFICWSKEYETENLLQIDLGLMPLIRTNESSGTCSYKLLQYMSLGVVPVASAVYVNKGIIDDGVNGFLVEDEQDWTDILLKAMNRKTDFSHIGQIAFEGITDKYTFRANEKPYLNFIHKLVSTQ